MVSAVAGSQLCCALDILYIVVYITIHIYIYIYIYIQSAAELRSRHRAYLLMFCLLFISNLIFRQTRRHEANILRLGAFLGPHHASSCIMHHASSSSSSGKLLSLCGDEMGSWIAGFAPEGGTQHDAEITLRVGDASVGRTQFSIGKLSKFQTKMTQKSTKNQ